MKSSSYPASPVNPHWRRAMHLPELGISTTSTRHHRGFASGVSFGGAAQRPRGTAMICASRNSCHRRADAHFLACMGPTPFTTNAVS